MSKRQVKGFTLVELLVVIGIIALLISILLPSLNKARQQAMVVQCASNLRQLYNGCVLYSDLFYGYALPARAASGSEWQNYWFGVNTLGAAMGFKVAVADNSAKDANGETQQEILTMQKYAKFLWCPASVIVPNEAASAYPGDYIYNQDMGDSRAYTWDTGNYQASYAPDMYFKKFTQVPPNIILACDANAPVQQNDEYFDTVQDLTYKKEFGGHPHANNTKGNILMQDGTVHLVRIWNPPAATTTWNAAAFQWSTTLSVSTVPSTYTDLVDPNTVTGLANWQVMCPGHYTSSAASQPFNYTTDRNSVWQKDRPYNYK